MGLHEVINRDLIAVICAADCETAVPFCFNGLWNSRFALYNFLNTPHGQSCAVYKHKRLAPL